MLQASLEKSLTNKSGHKKQIIKNDANNGSDIRSIFMKRPSFNIVNLKKALEDYYIDFVYIPECFKLGYQMATSIPVVRGSRELFCLL
jgi:hypothetical protein